MSCRVTLVCVTSVCDRRERVRDGGAPMAKARGLGGARTTTACARGYPGRWRSRGIHVAARKYTQRGGARVYATVRLQDGGGWVATARAWRRRERGGVRRRACAAVVCAGSGARASCDARGQHYASVSARERDAAANAADADVAIRLLAAHAKTLCPRAPCGCAGCSPETVYVVLL